MSIVNIINLHFFIQSTQNDLSEMKASPADIVCFFLLHFNVKKPLNLG